MQPLGALETPREERRQLILKAKHPLLTKNKPRSKGWEDKYDKNKWIWVIVRWQDIKTRLGQFRPVDAKKLGGCVWHKCITISA